MLSPKAAILLAADILTHLIAKGTTTMRDDRRRWEHLLNAARELDGTYPPTPEGVLTESLLSGFDGGDPTTDLPGYAVGEFLRALQAQIRAYNDETPADDDW